jgi:hypothetical protein
MTLPLYIRLRSKTHYGIFNDPIDIIKRVFGWNSDLIRVTEPPKTDVGTMMVQIFCEKTPVYIFQILRYRVLLVLIDGHHQIRISAFTSPLTYVTDLPITSLEFLKDHEKRVPEDYRPY